MTDQEFLELLEKPLVEDKLTEIYKKIQNKELTQALPVQEDVEKLKSAEELKLAEEQKKAEEESEVAKLKDMIQTLRDTLSRKEKELQHEKESSVKMQAENKGLQKDIAREQRTFQQNYSSLEKDAKDQLASRDRQHHEKLDGVTKRANATITALQGEISQKDEKNRDLAAENSSLTDELHSARSIISKFEKEQESFRLYQGLPDTVKSELKNVFRENTFENFIACCSQKETMESLWTFTKTRIFSGNLECLNELSVIFAFSVHCHNSTWETPVIHMVDGNVGERFSTLSHIGTPDSSKAGTVEKVLFSGYAVGKDMKVKQKAIVVVR